MSTQPLSENKMIAKERRRQFFINKPLQLRYMFTLSLILLVAVLVTVVNLYFGIWGDVLDAFSDTKIQNDLVTAIRLQQYDDARGILPQTDEGFSSLSLFREVERMGVHQREIFKDILDQTNRGLWFKLLPLFLLIAVGTIFLSHKIAGPLFRFRKIFESVAEGDLTVRCQLRKFDEAKPAAESLNRMLISLDGAMLRIKKIIYEEAGERDKLLIRLKEELEKFKTGTGH